jgi:hypothetical protein
MHQFNLNTYQEQHIAKGQRRINNTNKVRSFSKYLIEIRHIDDRNIQTIKYDIIGRQKILIERTLYYYGR